MNNSLDYSIDQWRATIDNGSVCPESFDNHLHDHGPNPGLCHDNIALDLLLLDCDQDFAVLEDHYA